MSLAVLVPVRTCSEPGCNGLHEARGMCHTHYAKWRYHNPGLTSQPKPLAQRLEERIERDPVTGCWLWTGALATTGYGNIRVNGVRTGAHRASYEHYVGPIPEGLHLDHLCRTPRCVNPSHLEPVSRWTNIRRGNPSPPVVNAQRTHCVNGHEFTPDNTSYKPNGARRCKECMRRRARAYYSRNRAKQ